MRMNRTDYDRLAAGITMYHSGVALLGTLTGHQVTYENPLRDYWWSAYIKAIEIAAKNNQPRPTYDSNLSIFLYPPGFGAPASNGPAMLLYHDPHETFVVLDDAAPAAGQLSVINGQWRVTPTDGQIRSVMFFAR